MRPPSKGRLMGHEHRRQAPDGAGPPADLLCALPYLLGFHPTDSLVVAGFAGRPPDGRLRLTARWDLPLAAGATARLAPLLTREDVTRVALVGYGPARSSPPRWTR